MKNKLVNEIPKNLQCLVFRAMGSNSPVSGAATCLFPGIKVGAHGNKGFLLCDAARFNTK